MSLYEKWEQITNMEMEPRAKKNYWEEYFSKEKDVYQEILKNKEFEIQTTVKDFAEKYKMNPEWVIGFIDGINTSLKAEVEVKSLEEESSFNLSIDVEKLFFNMHGAQADWLYDLPEWEDVLSIERRQEIEKEYKASKIVIRENKIGRNDPCTCGSGKKFKKCCGL
jgi:uncharacterized protein YecA (UPF0149 family)